MAGSWRDGDYSFEGGDTFSLYNFLYVQQLKRVIDIYNSSIISSKLHTDCTLKTGGKSNR